MDANGKVRLLLADEHALFRAGLKDLLNGASRFVIVGEASSGPEALEMVEKSKPDVVLLDIGLPGMDGIACTRQIKQKHPGVMVLVLSTYDDELHVMEALEAGANGYLSKRFSAQDLLQSVEAVHQDCYLIPTNLMARLTGADHKLQVSTQEDSSGAVTRCEMRVLFSLAHGYSNKQIAEEIFVSEKTVKNHLNHLFKKLGVKNRTEAVLRAMERGLVAML
ncbi:MAG: response regulator transcription factor [Elusimicrobiota bacterium]|jgi:DNA-binding NarL/FixJ family response regulator